MTTEHSAQPITLADFDAAAQSFTVPTQGLLFLLAEIVRAQEARIAMVEQEALSVDALGTFRRVRDAARQSEVGTRENARNHDDSGV